MNALSPVRKIVMSAQSNSETIRVSSPMKLIVGGSAMFVKQARSHQDVMAGVVSCTPCVSNRVRECVRS